MSGLEFSSRQTDVGFGRRLVKFCSGRVPSLGDLKQAVPLIDYLYDANTRYLSITGD